MAGAQAWHAAPTPVAQGLFPPVPTRPRPISDSFIDARGLREFEAGTRLGDDPRPRRRPQSPPHPDLTRRTMAHLHRQEPACPAEAGSVRCRHRPCPACSQCQECRMLLLLKIAASLAALYLVVVVSLALFQDRLLFPKWAMGPGAPLP